jgi:hypothetical protein
MKTLALSLCVCFGVVGAHAAAPPPPVTAVAYQADGKLLLAGTHGQVALINPQNGEVVGKIAGQTDRVTALAFNRAGDRLAVASGEPSKSGEIRLYEMKNGSARLLQTLSPAHKDIIYALTFSPDGKLLASAGYDRIIKLWNTETPAAAPRLLQDHSDTIYGLAFHPEGKLLASAAADRAVKVWDVASGKRLFTLSDPTDWVYTVAWSPDGKRLAAAGIDKSIRVWAANAEGGELVHAVFAHTQPVTRIAYSLDSTALFSISEGPNIKRWDAATMKEKLVFPPQSESLLCLALSPDQKQVAVGRFDGALVLFDAGSGKIISQPLPAKPKPPVLLKLGPNAVVRGRTDSVLVEGKNLAGVDAVSADRPDVKVGIVEVARTTQSDTRLAVSVNVPADASVGVVNLSLRSPAGNSATRPLFVDRYPAVDEKGAKDSPRIGMMVNVPATLVGSIGRAGDADYFRFVLKAGDEIAVQALTAAIGSKLEPVLELTDANGRPLAESASGLLGFKCRAAGTYALGIRDKDYRGGADFTYRVSVGRFPLVLGVFPPSVQRGTAQDVELIGVNLGGAKSQAHIVASVDAAPGSKVSVPLPKFAEPIVGSAQIVVGEFPEMRVDRERCTIATPATAVGVMREGFQTIEFPAKKGERLIVEVEAARLGSPLDSTIDILGPRDQPVLKATLRCVARTFSTFRDNDSAAPGIRLESWNELAIDDYLFVDGELMRIKQLPKGPDDDCQFYQTAGQRFGFLGTTPTHHAMGSPMYKVEIHPPGATFPPNGLPLINLPYRNDDGGPGFGKDSRIFFDPPADGRFRVRIRDARGQGGEQFVYRLTVRPPRPDFAVTFNPMAPAVRKGESITINVTASRLDGYNGPIQVRLDDLTPGFTAAPTFIEPGQTTTAFPLDAAADATIPMNAKPLKLTARATIGDKEIVHEATGALPKILAPGDLVTTTAVQEVTLEPGQSTKLLVRVERRNGFAGRVPLEVRGLPHGVRVQNIGLNGILITERETQREVVLYAEPWVQPMERPIIVLAVREGTKAEHGAKAVSLKISKRP